MEPGDDTNAAILSRVLSAIGGSDSFVLSFLFGGVVIALYAGKRLGDLISPPKDEEYDFTRMLSLSVMVGRDVFYRSYVFYVFFLEFVYVILCVFQPLAGILQGGARDIEFGGSTWPLAAALLVVGILPATPIVAQIEQSLRRFAHSLANIPDEFYNRVTALSTQDIETIAAKSSMHDDDVKFFWRVTNILLVLGYDYDDATRKARKCVSLRVFGEWTLEGKDLWSQSEYAKYRDVIDLLQPRFNELNEQLTSLTAESESSDFVTGVARRNGNLDLAEKMTVDQAATLRRDAERILTGAAADPAYTLSAAETNTFSYLRGLWNKTTKECDIAAKRLIALFAIIARNDKRTLRELDRPLDAKLLEGGGVVGNKRLSDPVLRAFAKLIRSTGPTSEPWYNSILSSVLMVFAVAIATLAIYRIGTGNRFFRELIGSPALPLDFSSLVRTSIIKALVDSFFLSLAFWLSSITALFLRSGKLRDQDWSTFYDFRTIPISSYFGVFSAASVAAFPVFVLQYVIFYTVSDQSTGGASYMIEVMITNIGVAMSFGLYGVGLCILTDMISMDRGENLPKTCLLVSAPAMSLNFIVLLASPGYLSNPVYLVNQTLLYGIIVYGGLVIFGRSLHSRLELSTREPHGVPVLVEV